ncbi:GDSL esterase/lipase LIP-4 [Sesamum angolense]|uniref:GDSL esterase/lipase LIP-4 n=1 Tax=Sesamum angolense TaxID=2727404 RepID=A0AAE1W9S6_9LAMI|nr:GDSL esterase/lipase LIP-4 [Sesamum angolense]
MHIPEHGFSALRLLAFLALINVVLPQCSTKTPVIFNFGDSNSDTGGFVAGVGLEIAYPYSRAFFRRPTGRASDGRLVIDFLCEYLDTHYLSPYLDSLEPDFTNGANFAIVGASTLPKSIHSFNLGKTNFLEKHDFENALYTLDIGQNDLSGSFWSLSYAQVIERIPSFISEIKDAMWAIYRVGGRNFWVHNTGPLGCLPRELAIRSNGSAGDYNEYGCLTPLNQGAKAFNAQLEALCEELRSQMENATIVYVDVYSIKYDLVANSTHYGFKNPLMACCGYGGAPYNYDDSKTCLDSEHTVCEEGRQHISWDGVHYSEAANSIVASKILSTHYSSPPLQFDFFCNNAASSFCH